MLRFGIDKTQVPRRPGRPPRPAPWPGSLDVDPRRTPSGCGPPATKAFVEAIVLRGAATPSTALPARRPDPRRRCASATRCRWRPPASSPRPILGTVGPVTAEMVKESDGVYQAGDDAGLSGLQARYDEQLRGTPGVAGRGGAPTTGQAAASSSASTPDAGHAARDHARPAAPDRGRAGRSPASGRPARWSRSGPRPATIARRRQRPGDGGLNDGDRRPVRARARRSRWSAAWRCCGRARRRRHRWTARPPSSSTASGSRTTATTRPAASAGSRCAPRWPTPATPPSSASATRLEQPDLADAAASLGHRRRPRPRLPGVLRQRAGRAEAGSETGHAADMIGQGKVAGLADGDGHRDRLGQCRAHSSCPGCCPVASSPADRRPTPLTPAEAATLRGAAARRGHRGQRRGPGRRARRRR